MTSCEIIYITHPDYGTALELSRRLVELRLIACANIFQNITSVYSWENKLEQATECVIIAKTQGSLSAQVREIVLEAHPYECPCVVSVPIASGNPLFLQWITEQTS